MMEPEAWVNWTGLCASGIACLGLVLLTRAPLQHGRSALRLGLAFVIWSLAWQVLAHNAGGLVTQLDPNTISDLGVGLLNAGFALLAWALAWIFVRLSNFWGQSPIAISTLLSLCWAGGVIAPDLGLGGAWSIMSGSLALTSLILTLLLGHSASRKIDKR